MRMKLFYSVCTYHFIIISIFSTKKYLKMLKRSLKRIFPCTYPFRASQFKFPGNHLKQFLIKLLFMKLKNSIKLWTHRMPTPPPLLDRIEKLMKRARKEAEGSLLWKMFPEQCAAWFKAKFSVKFFREIFVLSSPLQRERRILLQSQ